MAPHRNPPLPPTMQQPKIAGANSKDDLPKRKLALAEQEGVLARVLADLEQQGHAEPATLLLPARSASSGISSRSAPVWTLSSPPSPQDNAEDYAHLPTDGGQEDMVFFM